jgi:TRAP-type uncharacterized transport system fused permease subunit
LLGNTLQIAVVVVVPFIIMGQVLTRCGGSEFFSDLASALMGQFRGGSAKVAVVGSAFFGMVSGSAVANVASVGTITIPLMKRNGFPGTTAGAIEAVGSTGGQIAPPVMGAAAFLMAEYLQVPYSEVMIAAIIPALLWYATLFIQVDLESAKLGIIGAPRSQLPSIGKVMREGGHFLLPFVVLVGGLLWLNWEPEYAALMGTGVLILLVLIVPHKGKRMTIREVLSALVSSGGAVVDIIAVTAIAGILIGAMNLTGVAFSLTQQLIGSAAAACRCCSSSPDLRPSSWPAASHRRGLHHPRGAGGAGAGQAGVSPMQAHMFVLFNGLLGMVTSRWPSPAGGDDRQGRPWKTGWSPPAGWCCYLIPFLFAYTPALVMKGDPLSILISLSLVLLGILIGTMAVVGYFSATIPKPYRVAYGLVALMVLVQPAMFDGAVWVNVAGVLAAIVVLAREVVRGRSQPKLAPSPQSARNPAMP